MHNKHDLLYSEEKARSVEFEFTTSGDHAQIFIKCITILTLSRFPVVILYFPRYVFPRDGQHDRPCACGRSSVRYFHTYIASSAICTHASSARLNKAAWRRRWAVIRQFNMDFAIKIPSAVTHAIAQVHKIAM